MNNNLRRFKSVLISQIAFLAPETSNKFNQRLVKIAAEIALLLPLTMTFSHSQPAQAKLLWQDDFSPGWQQRWQAKNYRGKDNFQIRSDKQLGDYVRVTFDKEVAGTSGGFGFDSDVVKRLVDGSRENLYLSYYVRFKPSFEWRLGGKLPGLMTRLYGGVTGCADPNGKNGFSSRYMWSMRGELQTYLYLPNQKNYPKPDCGYRKKVDGFKFTPGKWHHVIQQVKLNTPGKANGRYRIWADGKLVTDYQKVTYRSQEGKFKIDLINFATYFGGRNKKWAPTKAGNYVDFAAFSIHDTFPERSLPSARQSRNLALNQPITGSVQSQKDHPVSNVVDGKSDTRWSAQSYPQKLEIKLGESSQEIDRLDIVPLKGRAYQFKAVTGDGRLIVDRTNNTEGGEVISASFKPIKTKNIKLIITGCYGNSCSEKDWVSIQEIKVFGAKLNYD
ncbi:discoidin domain-containing protein [Pleurocapsales cyanobacterium LEGE 10410]|nr:discoidin domain-containing protein [Pleurocapsales cyanobacterium LEGE 10410]